MCSRNNKDTENHCPLEKRDGSCTHFIYEKDTKHERLFVCSLGVGFLDNNPKKCYLSTRWFLQRFSTTQSSRFIYRSNDIFFLYHRLTRCSTRASLCLSRFRGFRRHRFAFSTRSPCTASQRGRVVRSIRKQYLYFPSPTTLSWIFSCPCFCARYSPESRNTVNRLIEISQEQGFCISQTSIRRE